VPASPKHLKIVKQF